MNATMPEVRKNLTPLSFGFTVEMTSINVPGKTYEGVILSRRMPSIETESRLTPYIVFVYSSSTNEKPTMEIFYNVPSHRFTILCSNPNRGIETIKKYIDFVCDYDSLQRNQTIRKILETNGIEILLKKNTTTATA
jgi:hypothetical protein